MRAFIGVELPEPVLDAVLAMQDDLPGRHVEAGNLHLTLAFLGDVGEARLGELHALLSGLRLAAPLLRVTALDVFEGRKPTLAFAAVAPDPALEAARRAVRKAARDVGIDLKRERFHPHVTLTRFGRAIAPRDAARLAACLGPVPPVEAHAGQFGLFHSELRAEGPRYHALAHYGFG